LGEIQRYVRNVRDAPDLGAITHILSDATRAFEFDYFALVQRLGQRVAQGPVRLSDYPAEWLERLGRTSYHVHDPVLVACEKSAAPFSWDALPAMFTLSRHQQHYMAAARAAGLGGGYTVPIHVPGGASGLCSFVTTGTRALPAGSLPAAQYLACFAFEAARRLADCSEGAPGLPAIVRLTQRQLDCVVLAARGKSNWVAGRLLGLSPDTVHKYLESAKQRYGVSSRTELVVRALYDGQLSFADVLENKRADMTPLTGRSSVQEPPN
jgi:LuxR family quorum-sensing system transcriptional regulator CciR